MMNNKEKPYSFWPSEAVQHGIEKAVILYNLRFWLTVNKAAGKEKHYHEGKWWTYNTAKAIENLMPFFNRRSISRWLSELERDGVLLSGMFNKVAYDRTKWYTIPAEFSEDAIGQNDQSIGQDGQSNGQDDQWNGQDGQPIPDCNPVSNPVDNLTPPTGVTAPEGADSVCSLCLGYQWTHGNQCERCNGTGLEPTCNDGLQVVNSELTTDQPKASADTAEQVRQTEHEAAPADKPVKKRKTKAETLLDMIRSKPELLVCLNCVDDTLLLEWCQQRERMKAARTDRALSKIDRALDELRTKHRVAPDAAIEAACDKGWRGLEVEWVLNHLSSTGRNMSYQSGGQDVNNTPQINQPTMFDTELTEERKAKNEEMRGKLADLMEGFKK